MKLSAVTVLALVSTTANGFSQTPSQRSLGSSSTQLQFGFLKELGLEKPDFLPDFGSKDSKEPEEILSYSNGIQVGDAFPTDALKKWGVSGKKSVVFFYGADDAPSCSKQIAGFNDRADEFKKLGATVVGVRNQKGVKEDKLPELVQKLYVDENDEIRNRLGIKKDLGLLGGRETYVVGKNGKVEYKFNAQLKPEAHIENTIDFLSN